MYKVIKIIDRVIGLVALSFFIAMLIILSINTINILKESSNVRDGIIHLTQIAFEFVKSKVLGGIL